MSKRFNTLYSGFYQDNCYPFATLANSVEHAKVPEDLTDPNGALILWGGSDINPDFYKHPASRTTYAYPTRDNAEWALLHKAKELGMTIIGVCRGAQMLCAAAGGFLLQDVRGHHGEHEVVTKDDRVFTTNSIHHQMMAGYEKVGHELLGWSLHRLSKDYVWKADELFPIPDRFVEPEYIYFTDIKGHAIQWHPEAMGAKSDATQYILQAIKER